MVNNENPQFIGLWWGGPSYVPPAWLDHAIFFADIQETKDYLEKTYEDQTIPGTQRRVMWNEDSYGVLTGRPDAICEPQLSAPCVTAEATIQLVAWEPGLVYELRDIYPDYIVKFDDDNQVIVETT